MVVGVVAVVVVTDVPEVFSAVDPYVTVWVVACWVVAGGCRSELVPVVVVGEVPDVVVTVVPVACFGCCSSRFWLRRDRLCSNGCC